MTERLFSKTSAAFALIPLTLLAPRTVEACSIIPDANTIPAPGRSAPASAPAFGIYDPSPEPRRIASILDPEGRELVLTTEVKGGVQIVRPTTALAEGRYLVAYVRGAEAPVSDGVSAIRLGPSVPLGPFAAGTAVTWTHEYPARDDSCGSDPAQVVVFVEYTPDVSLSPFASVSYVDVVRSDQSEPPPFGASLLGGSLANGKKVTAVGVACGVSARDVKVTFRPHVFGSEVVVPPTEMEVHVPECESEAGGEDVAPPEAAAASCSTRPVGRATEAFGLLPLVAFVARRRRRRSP